MSNSRSYVARVPTVAVCQSCGVQLTREEADGHRRECHAFVGQIREERKPSRASRITAYREDSGMSRAEAVAMVDFEDARD